MALTLSISLSGCALLFQESLSANYSPRKSEPYCSTSAGWPIVDMVFGASNAALAIGAAGIEPETSGYEEVDQEANTRRTAYIVSGVAGALIHGISAATGFGWANECKEAREKRAAYLEQKDERAEQDARIQRARLERQLVRERAARRARDDEGDDESEEEDEAGNGFFCSSASCSRDAESCDAGRSQDEQPCVASPTAFCFGGGRFRVCRTTLAACERQLSASGFGDRTSCDETH